MLSRLLATLSILLLTSCSGLPPTPSAIPPFDLDPDQIVVLVPGITGSVLSTADGQIAWGDTRSLFLPRDRGRALALPLTGDDEVASSALRATALIREIRLFGGLWTKPVYGPLLDLLVENGYRLGSFEEPHAGDRLFPFPYDWRQDNVASARQLVESLERVREVRGRPIEVALICQSNGAHLCRYAAKHGAASLAEAEAGQFRLPEGVQIRTLVLVGTSNGGSLRILRELNRGRSYAPLIGRRWGVRAIFSFRSLYQDLPTYRSDLFFDEEGRPLDVDLFDPEAWERYGWSVFADAESLGPDALEQARRFVATALDRGRRFHQILRRDSEAFRVRRYCSIQSTSVPTPERALLVSGSRPATYFEGDRKVGRNGALSQIASEPGDGHASLTSQGWLSPQELRLMPRGALEVDGPHFEMILAPRTRQRLLECLSKADLRD